MIKALKEFKKETDARIKRQEIARDEENRAVLEMTVRDTSGFLSPYSHSAAETVSEEAAEFLRNSALGLNPSEELSLHVHSDCIDEHEQRVYPHAIRTYFERHYADTRREMRSNAIQSAIMLTVGLLALAVMILGEHLGWGQIWIECIDIFAWVFLWETVDLFFLTRTMLRRRARRYLAFMRIHIKFFSLTSQQPPEEIA